MDGRLDNTTGGNQPLAWWGASTRRRYTLEMGWGTTSSCTRVVVRLMPLRRQYCRGVELLYCAIHHSKGRLIYPLCLLQKGTTNIQAVSQ